MSSQNSGGCFPINVEGARQRKREIQYRYLRPNQCLDIFTAHAEEALWCRLPPSNSNYNGGHAYIEINERLNQDTNAKIMSNPFPKQEQKHNKTPNHHFKGGPLEKYAYDFAT